MHWCILTVEGNLRHVTKVTNETSIKVETVSKGPSLYHINYFTGIRNI